MTSAHERGPRGRQPRRRWASLTCTNEALTAGTRLRDAAIAAPVRESAAGRASITSCDASIKEKGAADTMAAATVRPPDAPAARASSVYGPPTAGIDAGSSKRIVAPRCAAMKFKRVAKAAI